GAAIDCARCSPPTPAARVRAPRRPTKAGGTRPVATASNARSRPRCWNRGPGRTPERRTRRSARQRDPYRRVVAGTLPGARFAVDARFDRLAAQGVGDQGQVDAQAEVAAERGLAVIPPAEDAGLVVVQAEAVVQAQRQQPLQ